MFFFSMKDKRHPTADISRINLYIYLTFKFKFLKLLKSAFITAIFHNFVILQKNTPKTSKNKKSVNDEVGAWPE